MTIADLSQLLTALASCAAVGLSALSLRKIGVAVEKVEEVRHATNSLTDRLVASTDLAARAEGMAQGRADATAEHRATDT